MRTFEYTIKDELGIHARPAGMLAKASKLYESEITISKGEKKAVCTKLMAVMGLGVKNGAEVVIKAEGDDEDVAIAKMQEFMSANL